MRIILILIFLLKRWNVECRLLRGADNDIADPPSEDPSICIEKLSPSRLLFGPLKDLLSDIEILQIAKN